MIICIYFRLIIIRNFDLYVKNLDITFVSRIINSCKFPPWLCSNKQVLCWGTGIADSNLAVTEQKQYMNRTKSIRIGVVATVIWQVS